MTVTTVDQDGAQIVVWDRTERRNAWDRLTMTGIAEAIAAAAADPGVRCIVLRGAGEHFSAGDDLFSALEADAAAWADTIEAFQHLTRVVLAADVPVIAAIDGVCIGGALELAASCDLRIATERARFATPEVRIGLTATNAGTLLLPEILGETAARELLLTGALRDAEWALRNRFVAEVVPASDFDTAIQRWAAAFEGTSRAAVAATKRMLVERLGELLPAAMERETRWCLDLFETDDARNALAAFAAGRRSAG